MQTLVENVMSLEREADSILAQARVDAKEVEKKAQAEAEAHRLKLVEATEQKVSAFQKETREKHQRDIAEAEKDLARALEAVDQISDGVLKEQVDRIVTRFSEW